MLGDRPNQLDKLREDVHVDRRRSCSTSRSTPGDGHRGRAAQQHQRRHPVPRGLAARAAAPSAIHNLMEDAATAEISRSQVWQWLHNGVELSRRPAGHPRAGRASSSTRRWRRSREQAGDAFADGRWDDARALFTEMALADDYVDFLTLPAYERMP